MTEHCWTLTYFCLGATNQDTLSLIWTAHKAVLLDLSYLKVYFQDMDETSNTLIMEYS